MLPSAAAAESEDVFMRRVLAGSHRAVVISKQSMIQTETALARSLASITTSRQAVQRTDRLLQVLDRHFPGPAKRHNLGS